MTFDCATWPQEQQATQPQVKQSWSVPLYKVHERPGDCLSFALSQRAAPV